MVFIEWWLVLQVCTIVLFVTSGAYGIWVVRGKRWLLRLPVRVVSLLLLLLGVGDAVFVWAFPNPNNYSVPLCSPSRKMAIRVHEYDASGFGSADTSVRAVRGSWIWGLELCSTGNIALWTSQTSAGRTIPSWRFLIGAQP